MRRNLRYRVGLAGALALLAACTATTDSALVARSKQLPPGQYELRYEVADWPQPDYSKPFTFDGNHRLLIRVPAGLSGPVQVLLPWRRPDLNPAQKAVIVRNAATGEPISPVRLLDAGNESGRIVFQPAPGVTDYLVYYLPHESTGKWYPVLNYLKPDSVFPPALNLSAEAVNALPAGQTIAEQSIDPFNSFFPMEVIATRDEVQQFVAAHPRPFYLFPEYRGRSIRMSDHLPRHWVTFDSAANGLADSVRQGEYYTFQLGVYAPDKPLRNVQVEVAPIGICALDTAWFTCFNTGGTDLNGKKFTKQVDVEAGKVQALWMGVDIPEDAAPGVYLQKVRVRADGIQPQTAWLRLTVVNEKAVDRGDGQAENMTHLRWLNSTLGNNPQTIIRPFVPVTASGSTIKILGREIELNELGFPQSIRSYFTPGMTRLADQPEEVLAGPVTFDVTVGGRAEKWTRTRFGFDQSYPSTAGWTSVLHSNNFDLELNARLEYDGMLDYRLTLVAREAVSADDMQLQIPMRRDAAVYMLGLGRKGGKFPGAVDWKWDVTRHQEGVWLGNVHKGLQYVLRDENYVRPLNTNFYQSQPLNLPPSWYNEGKGGIRIGASTETVLADNYSGPRSLQAGDTLHFNIRFLVTPFKLVDTHKHFQTRFVHQYVPVDTVLARNGTIVNVHHATAINPYINYPFYALDKQKAYIDEAHRKGVKVKLYNTIREISYKAWELFAFSSLGDEIVNDGEGGGHSWLQEHLRDHYHKAWHATEVNDAAVLDKGNSRMTNYYIEGLNWLAKNQQIDGIYLDDIAFSRETVKRIAHVFYANRENYVIDLHSANQFNYNDGFVNSAFLYMEHFPYITRLWFGEYFDYNQDPDYWLTEVSGFPFGLTGEMLQDGGHPFRGLVYGMTSRYWGETNPQPIWKLLIAFGAADAEMLGYWVDRSPVKTETDGIRSTVYRKKDELMLAIGSWSKRDELVPLLIDWKALGFAAGDAELYSVPIDGLQQQRKYDPSKPVLVPANQGLVLILKKKQILN